MVQDIYENDRLIWESTSSIRYADLLPHPEGERLSQREHYYRD